MTDKKFATVINCMDGRVQLPVIGWIKKRYDVDYVDTITEPGPELLLSENTERGVIESILRRLEISVTKHHSSLVAIVAHHDCAGNPSDREAKKAQMHKAILYLKSCGFDIDMIALYVDEAWQVHQVE